MKFEKKNGRFLLTQRERVLSVLNEFKSLDLSKLSHLSKVQYGVLKYLIYEMQKENLVKIHELRSEKDIIIYTEVKVN